MQAGGNFIDTANVYCKWLEGHGNCSEQIIGKWLKDRGTQGKVIVTTKGAHYSFEDQGRSRVNREDIRTDLDESCRTLGTDVIDFYYAEMILRRNRQRKSLTFWKNCRKKEESGISDFPITGQKTERDPEMSGRKKSSGNHGSFQPVEPGRDQSGRKHQSGSDTCRIFQGGI